MKTMFVAVGILLGLGLSSGQARTADSRTEARVEAIRKEFAAVEDAVAKGRLKESKITIGGGQNPNEILVHYEGGREQDYERDPYAAPFRLRRIRVTKMLPAVGESSLTLYFDREGALFFAFNTGADTVGTTYILSPPSQLRLYYHQGQVIRVIVSGLSGDGDDSKTVDLASATGEDKKQASAAGKAVLSRAQSIKQALHALSQ